MRLVWPNVLFCLAWLLVAAGFARAEGETQTDFLVADGWAILNGNSIYEPFCDRPAQALDRFMQAAQIDPANASAHRGWGRALEDQARCPVNLPVNWAQIVQLEGVQDKSFLSGDIPPKVLVEVIDHYSQAAKLDPSDMLAWTDWGRALFHLAAAADGSEERLNLSRLAAEKYEIAKNLVPGDREILLAWARGHLSALAAEDNPDFWPVLWKMALERYYAYINSSPDDGSGQNGVSPKLAAWSLFGREVSQVARESRLPDKAETILRTVVEALRLLVVAKPEYDLSLDVNSLSRAYLDLMALTEDKGQWLALLNQASGLALRMIELDHQNPVIDFVLWNWKLAIETEKNPIKRQTLLDKALEIISFLKEKDDSALKRAAQPAIKGANKGISKARKKTSEAESQAAGDSFKKSSWRADRFRLILAAAAKEGERDFWVSEALAGFEDSLLGFDGEAASKMRMNLALDLMGLAAQEVDPVRAKDFIVKAHDQFMLSLASTSHIELSLIAWGGELERLAETMESAKRLGEIKAAKTHSAPPVYDSKTCLAAALKRAAISQFSWNSKIFTGAHIFETMSCGAYFSSDNQLAKALGGELGLSAEAETWPWDRSKILYAAAVENYQQAADLPGGERAFDDLGTLFLRRAMVESDSKKAEKLWFKALINYRRAVQPGLDVPISGEALFKLGQIYATLSSWGPEANGACVAASGYPCLEAALKTYREFYINLPGEINTSISNRDTTIKPDLGLPIRPLFDQMRLGPSLGSNTISASDGTERRGRALTLIASEAFFQILLAIDPKAPLVGKGRNPKTGPGIKTGLMAPERAQLAALYRMAAGYRQMDPHYKVIYLRRAENL